MRLRTTSIITLLFLTSELTFFGQNSPTYDTLAALSRLDDSLTIVKLLEKANRFSSDGNIDSALTVAAMAADIASVNGFTLLEAASARVLGLNYGNIPSWDMMLFHYIKAASLYERSGYNDVAANINRTIALKYYNSNIYLKSAQYSERAFRLITKEDYPALAEASESTANAYFLVPNDSLAIEWYQTSAIIHQRAQDIDGYAFSRSKVASLYVRNGRLAEADSIFSELIDYYSKAGNMPEAAGAINNRGFIRFRHKDFSSALEDFISAIETSLKAEYNPVFLADVWANLGICYQTLENQSEMQKSFITALEHANEGGDSKQVARINYLLAGLYFKKGDNYHSELYCIDCIEAAKEGNAPEIMQECYLTYSDVMERGNDFIKALAYYEKYLSIRDSLSLEGRLTEKELSDRVEFYDAAEQRIRIDVADQEIRGLEIRNLKAESAKRENEYKLLLKQQELDRSEKERLAQTFAIERDQFELARRQQEVFTLQQQQERDSLLIKLKNDEALSLRQSNLLLEQEKIRNEETARQERQVRNMVIGIGILIFIAAVSILGGLIYSRRQNQRLAESKRQIELTNSEILKQKEIIEQKNQSITDSIQYASRIQNAVLPPSDFLSEWNIDNFILFRPKDIVSGDFYWGVKKDGKIIVAAADCTGHGVPGAFMSMLGHAFLDEIVNTRELTDAAGMLNILRDEIINTLRQKGSVGETRDGMDISLIMLDIENNYLHYAGANNPLYIIRDGEIIRVQADHMPIGIHFISFTPFTNNRMEIKKGDFLYLFSDGYADQFGGPRGKKFMYRPFQELLLTIHQLPMTEQQKVLEEKFLEWKGDHEQVDDVMVIGLHI